MADKKNLCAQIDTALHMRVRLEQEEEDTAEQPETEESDEPDMDANEEE